MLTLFDQTTPKIVKCLNGITTLALTSNLDFAPFRIEDEVLHRDQLPIAGHDLRDGLVRIAHNTARHTVQPLGDHFPILVNPFFALPTDESLCASSLISRLERVVAALALDHHLTPVATRSDIGRASLAFDVGILLGDVFAAGPNITFAVLNGHGCRVLGLVAILSDVPVAC